MFVIVDSIERQAKNDLSLNESPPIQIRVQPIPSHIVRLEDQNEDHQNSACKNRLRLRSCTGQKNEAAGNKAWGIADVVRVDSDLDNPFCRCGDRSDKDSKTAWDTRSWIAVGIVVQYGVPWQRFQF